MTQKVRGSVVCPIVLALLIFLCASGGHSAVSRVSDDDARKAILGTWICTASMMLEEVTHDEDGTARSVTRMFGPGGEFDIALKANWRVEEGNLNVKITASTLPEIVEVGETLNYEIVSISPRKLILKTSDGEEIPHYRKMEPDHAKLVEDFLETSGTRMSLEQAWQSIRNAQMKQIKSMKLPDDKQKAANEIVARLQDYLGRAIAYEKVKHYYAYLYADLFSREELKELIEFYKSDLGRKLISAMPKAMDQSMKDVMKKMQLLSPALDQIVQEALEEMGETRKEPGGA
jgi:hypothetical protein